MSNLRKPSSMLLAACLAPLLLLLMAAQLPFEFHLPPHFPYPPSPAENSVTEARVELGRKLFFDPVMSVDSTVSCGSCHKPSLAFADSLSVSPGVEGRLGTRNAPSVVNLAYRPNMLRDGGVPSIEMQVLVPVQEHAEMDFDLNLIVERLRKDSMYVRMSAHAYARRPDGFVVTRALSAYERTLLSGDSEWDKYYQSPEDHPMDQLSAKGLQVFKEKGCVNCHSGIFFSDFSRRNNGLKAQYPDSGLARVSELPEDVGIFVVSSLRNLRYTGPYMHDGSVHSLEEVVDHYASGGSKHKNQDPLIRPFKISKSEKAALVHFLRHGLADPEFIVRHQDDATRPIPEHLTRQAP